MNFQEAEVKYRELRGQLDAGTLNNEEFEERLKALMVKDDEGRFWNIGAETGKWYYFDEGQWVEGTPPPLAEAASVPPPPEEPDETETALIAAAPVEEAGPAEPAPTAPPAEEPGAAESPLPAWLEEPDEGETLLVAPSAAEPGAAETIIGTPLPPRLVVISGSRQGEKFTLQGEVRLGREEDNDIALDDPKVSRHHAVLRPEAGGYTIADMGSANGTFVNGQQITAPQALAEGDTITVGDTELVYHIGLIVEETAPAVAPGEGATLVGEAADVTLPPAPEPPPPPPPAYVPPPTPPPVYAPPPPTAPPEPVAAPAKKKRFSTCLIVVIVLAILLCCAAVIVGALAVQGGLLEGLSML